ncbi:Hok/Gef family protein [Proteus mirabilis]|nr:Hok/Gef family protein [Proteus mirabilis]EKU7917617.1 Hok/Gef family protein [Proteus mirabilis]EKU7920518.1 Hok/Gef family protein [Proteus mirabilis]EKU8691345.1 Hok/Gef family protein [Proteus mirabilis]EKU8703231.1 Hok/Gef family protein [Proteus mirabilis]
MTKLALIGLITVCITVLCFPLLRHERLCSFNISSGNCPSSSEFILR